MENERDGPRREQVGARIAQSVAGIIELFDCLLDISKLDAGGVAPALADVALAPLLQRANARCADDA